MQSNIYRGFSSKDVKNGFDTALTGISLVKTDLSNHFETGQYEMLGRPNHYCLIEELLFEKEDRGMQLVRQEAERVFRADPRVGVLEISIDMRGQMIVLIAKLLFKEYDMEDYFIHTFGGTR